MRVLLILLIALGPAGASAFDDGAHPVKQTNRPIISLTESAAFNGIEPTEVDRFWEKWPLVTTRFRNDNGQVRFVYANPEAWAAMNRRDGKYPKGAIFAKIAFETAPDPTFPASLVPRGFIRVQVMKRDEKLYAETGGWGYGLFEQPNEAPLPPRQLKELVVTCHACHQIVAGKQFVFSEPVYRQWNLTEPEAKAQSSEFEKKFALADTASLSDFAKGAVATLGGKPASRVKSYSMRLFYGSLMESLAAMSVFARRDAYPYLLSDEQSGSFLIVDKSDPGPGCKTRTHFAMVNRLGAGSYLRTGKVCDGQILIDDVPKVPASPGPGGAGGGRK